MGLRYKRQNILKENKEKEAEIRSKFNKVAKENNIEVSKINSITVYGETFYNLDKNESFNKFVSITHK